MRRLLTGSAIVVAVALFFGFSANAAPQFSNADNNTVEIGQTVDGSWYGAGQKVTIDGTVNGDLFCAAQQVEVTGTIKGDVLCAAQEITFTDKALVEGDVRLAGQNVKFEGTSRIDGSATVFAQRFNVESQAVIGQDLSGAAQEVSLGGTITRDVAIGSQNLQINGIVGRDVNVSVESINFGDKAEINGSMSYSSAHELSFNEAAVQGDVSWHRTETTETKSGPNTQIIIVSALAVIVFTFVIALILPKFLHDTSHQVENRFGLVLGVGVLLALGMFAVPIVGFLLLITFLGVYLSIALFIVWGLWLLMTIPVFAYYIGRLIPHGGNSNILMNALVGGVILAIALQVPYLASAAMLLAFVLGNGLLGLWIAKHFQAPDYDVARLTKKSKSTSKK